MATCVTYDFSARYNWVSKNYFDTHNPNAKEERDTYAKELKKSGYTVKTKSSSVCGSFCYSIDAKKEKDPAINGTCPVCGKPTKEYQKPYGVNDPAEYGTCDEHGLFVVIS
jgi:hypothetical protein